MKIALLHAYSSTNSGDGLLVHEAREALERAFPGCSVDLIALDPDGFDANSFSKRLHPILGNNLERSKLRMVFQIATNLGRGSLLHVETKDLVRQAELVVAVGGGYLRAKSAFELLKFSVAHLGQLILARNKGRTVYLPQSIGPLPVLVAPLVRHCLRNMNLVCVRDDVSKKFLSGLNNVVRIPDMALLGLSKDVAADVSQEPEGMAPPGIVARNLYSGNTARAYQRMLKTVHSTLESELLVQASARGNNDTNFYHRLGFEGSFSSLSSVAGRSHKPPVVISVRLHGAIQAIRAGIPSIHLSYERKGWGAFHDLNLEGYVHNARTVDPEVVVSQAIELAKNSRNYWNSVGEALDGLERDRRYLTSLLQEVAFR